MSLPRSMRRAAESARSTSASRRSMTFQPRLSDLSRACTWIFSRKATSQDAKLNMVVNIGNDFVDARSVARLRSNLHIFSKERASRWEIILRQRHTGEADYYRRRTVVGQDLV